MWVRGRLALLLHACPRSSTKRQLVMDSVSMVKNMTQSYISCILPSGNSHSCSYIPPCCETDGLSFGALALQKELQIIDTTGKGLENYAK